VIRETTAAAAPRTISESCTKTALRDIYMKSVNDGLPMTTCATAMTAAPAIGTADGSATAVNAHTGKLPGPPRGLSHATAAAISVSRHEAGRPS